MRLYMTLLLSMPSPFLEEHLLAMLLGRVGDVPEATSTDTLQFTCDPHNHGVSPALAGTEPRRAAAVAVRPLLAYHSLRPDASGNKPSAP